MAAVISKSETRIYEFENYRLVPAERLLLRDGQPVPLQPKIFETLLALVEKNGRLVEKDELIARLWPDTFVEEATLSRNISDLRKALGESGHERKFIETVPKCGYRFVAEVRESPSEETGVEESRHSDEKLIEEKNNDKENSLSVDAQPEIALKADTFLGIRRRTLIAVAVFVVSFTAIVAVLAWRSSKAREARDNSREKKVNSIAVLPFKSVSGQERDESLELGLADTLITRISNVKEINVRPSSAVFKYAGQNVDPVGAGKELKVDAVLDGNIQRLGDRARVFVQLVNVADGTTLWADKFDAKVTDFFTTQDALSEQITRSLTLHLTGVEQNTLTKRGTSNEEAYQLFLKGRYWFGKNTPEGLEKAVDYFNQAIVLDSNYAAAYSGLADAYSLQAAKSLVPPAERLLKAKAAAERAVQLDDNFAGSHISLGHLRWLTWDRVGAEKEFQRAVELNPPYPGAHLWYATYLSTLGRHQEAFAIIKKAQEQNPISIIVNECAESNHFFARQYTEAIAMGLKNLEIEPNRTETMYWLSLAYEQKGMYDEAVAMSLKALLLRGEKPEEVETLRVAYNTSGWRGYWLKRIEQAREAAKHRYVSPFNFAENYARIGDKERAFEFLEKAYAEHSDQLTLLKVYPVFDAMRSDPRYRELMRRVGFPDEK